ncbi:MAG: DUF642 domain-containing protein [Ketobacteraceae bacterium]|nr:DUF642 domain-containing protein [Ketobacteraceae bacterium]
MKLITQLVSATALAAALSATAQANLIQNGGFEDIGSSTALGGYGSASTWQIYSAIPDWNASQNIEIWTNNFIVPAYEGNNVLELNAHPGNAGGAFSIYQSFGTVTGQEYELTFAGRKRQANSNESFRVEVGDLVTSIYNQAYGSWTEYSYNFTALSDWTTLTFTSLDGGGDTTGNIFDAVSVTSVPEPGTFAMIGLGLVGLAFQRKKSQQGS